MFSGPPPKEGMTRDDKDYHTSVRRISRSARYEPANLDPKITDPRTKLCNKRKNVPPQRSGIPHRGPPTIAFCRLLRNLYALYSEVLWQCQNIRNNHDYLECLKIYHDTRRLFLRESLRRSANLVGWIRVCGMTLRFAKFTHCVKGPGNTKLHREGSRTESLGTRSPYNS